MDTRHAKTMPTPCIANMAAMNAPRAFLLAYSHMMVADNGCSPPTPTPSQKRKKQSVPVTFRYLEF
jgi:hypothetical protein